eukprot:tig00000540_g1940.t1
MCCAKSRTGSRRRQAETLVLGDNVRIRSEWATVARWVSYRDVRDGAPDAAALLSTVESVRRFDGVFPVVILDEGAKAIVTAALARLGRLLREASILLVSDADLCQHDVDYYLALRHPAPAAPGAARVVSYTLRPAPRGPAARREALAYPLGMAGTSWRRSSSAAAASPSPARTAAPSSARWAATLYVYADARAEERARALDKAHVCREVDVFVFNYALHQGADYTDPERPDRILVCAGGVGGSEGEEEEGEEDEAPETDPEAILAEQVRALEEAHGSTGTLRHRAIQVALRAQSHKLAVLRATRADPLLPGSPPARRRLPGLGVLLPGGAPPERTEGVKEEAKAAQARAFEIEVVLPHAAAPPLPEGRRNRRLGYGLHAVAHAYRLREEEVGPPELRLALRSNDRAAFLAHVSTAHRMLGTRGGRNILPSVADEAHSRRSAALLLGAAGWAPPVTPAAILSPSRPWTRQPCGASPARRARAAPRGAPARPLLEADELLAMEPAARPEGRLLRASAAALGARAREFKSSGGGLQGRAGALDSLGLRDDRAEAAAAGGADSSPLWATDAEAAAASGACAGAAPRPARRPTSPTSDGILALHPEAYLGERARRRGGGAPGDEAEAADELAGAVAGLAPAELAAIVRGGFAADARLDALAARLAAETHKALEARARREAGRGGPTPASPLPLRPVAERLPGPNGVEVQRAGPKSGRDLCVGWVEEHRRPALHMKNARVMTRGERLRGLAVPLALFAEMGIGDQP